MLALNRRLKLVLLICLVLGILVGGGVIGYSIGKSASTSQPSPSMANFADNRSGALASVQIPEGLEKNAVADIVARVSPAVVKIETTVEKSRVNPFDPFFNDPFFREFFGRNFDITPVPEVERGIGSGFIVSPDGYIVTNEHVVNGAKEIKVTVAGHKSPYEAEVVGSDFDLDLALLKIGAADLPVLTFGDSNQVRVGDWVIAIGNPYGLDHTVTVGVISAKGRPVTVERREYKNLLQTDASINPGNSGGPLLNLKGEVIGINTAINAAAQGIGFAIPSNTARSAVEELKQSGSIARPWLGVQAQVITPALMEYFGLESTEGAIITMVAENSPAEKAGLKRGDVIVEFNGEKVASPDSLAEAVSKQEVGKRVTLVIVRNRRVQYVTVEIGKKPANPIFR